ncbi:hypothetical protein, partial [Pseudomonas brassicacearum]|uniref:hypothetical protein n=1 Tax=Pseudomonas brassicacearum TaxID=930166 RepID=UPI001C62D1B2
QRSDKAPSSCYFLSLQAFANHSGAHGFAAFAVQLNDFQPEFLTSDPRLGPPLNPLIKAAALHTENTTHHGRRK